MHHRLFLFLFLVAMGAALQGCGTVSESSRTPVVQSASATTQSGGRLGTLPPQTLAQSECAMFLWSRGAERNLVFFSGRDGNARLVVGGQTTQFPRLQAEGAEALGQFEKQLFEYEEYTLSVDVEFEKRAGMARGVVVPQGSLRLTQTDGWELIMPVGGLVACEPP